MQLLLLITTFCLLVGYSINEEISEKSETVTVTTTAGEIMGRKSKLSSPMIKETESLIVSTFYGIPYARPPIGELRFKPPMEPEPWVGIRPAFEQPKSCIQLIPDFIKNVTKEEPKISEDCLYLNVIVPDPVPEKAAVMVWIYGGAYSAGSIIREDFRLFAATQKVIVVAMNYRVSSVGLLFLDSDDCPGNAGLWDQQLAMKWVHDNIVRFEGDPTKVTIFGHSAGSASVGHQLLNPVSQKYFKRAILQSGSPYAAWAADSKKLALKKSREVAEAVGCYDTANNSLINCLRRIDAEKLVETSAKVAGVVSKFHAPVFDNHFVFEDRLSTLNLLRNKQVLLGFTSNDGGFLVRTLLELAKIEPKEILERSVYQYIGETNVDLGNITKESLNSIKYYYKDHCGEIKEYAEEVASTRLMTDYFFTCATTRLADALSDTGVSTFLYQFNHKSLNSNLPKWIEADHGAELSFLKGAASMTPIEYELSSRIMNYWSNFAKHGDPNYGGLFRPIVSDQNRLNTETDKKKSSTKVIETWPQYTVKEKGRVDIDLDSSLRAFGEVQEDQCAFWNHDVPLLIKGRA